MWWRVGSGLVLYARKMLGETQSCAVCVCGWVHKRGSGVHGRLQYMTDFNCATCRGNNIIEPRMERINIRNVTLEYIDELCYLGDMIRAGDGAEGSSIMSQV